VEFTRKTGSKVFVRVDGDLPVDSMGRLFYADRGGQSSIWVAIMEKAYACYRNANVASYGNLDSGWMDEAFLHLGYSPSSLWSASSATLLMNQIKAQLDAGRAVTLGTKLPELGAPVIASHAYSVVQVIADAAGTLKSLVLRNPWGMDGAGSDGRNDGYVTLTAAQAYASWWGLMWANVG
jgi:hypothetical protein